MVISWFILSSCFRVSSVYTSLFFLTFRCCLFALTLIGYGWLCISETQTLGCHFPSRFFTLMSRRKNKNDKWKSWRPWYQCRTGRRTPIRAAGHITRFLREGRITSMAKTHIPETKAWHLLSDCILSARVPSHVTVSPQPLMELAWWPVLASTVPEPIEDEFTRNRFPEH